MPPQYKNAKIYKLVSNISPDVYIGSCLVDLCKRLSGHKNGMNTCSSKKMFENDAIITIALLEALPNCKSKAELNARELYYITTIPCINKNKPFITDVKVVGGNRAEWTKAYNKEYQTDHAEERKEQQKAYTQDHIEEKREYDREYRAKNAEELNRKKRETRAKLKLANTDPSLNPLL
jgi:hypothetical protein